MTTGRENSLRKSILASVSALAFTALLGSHALAADCPAITVADDQGIAGTYPQQFELSEFEGLANCKMTF